MRYRHPLTILCLSVLCFSATAQGSATSALTDTAASTPEQNTETPASQTVSVRAVKYPEWKPYRVFLKGIDAFEANHKLAPHAKLQFVIKPQQTALLTKDITVRIVGKETSIPVPVAPNGTFTLPRIESEVKGDAELVLNVKKDSVRWRPYVRTAELGPNVRRLGDLRLECKVVWVVEYDDIPFLLRNLVRLAGGPCKSSKIQMSFSSPKPLLAATVVEGERRVPLHVHKDGLSFIGPVHDNNWSDDALIELQYLDDMQAINTPAQAK
jgi:hypothetical protein